MDFDYLNILVLVYKYGHEKFDYESQSFKPYQNISVIDSRVSTTILNIFKTEGDINRWLDLLKEQLLLIQD